MLFAPKERGFSVLAFAVEPEALSITGPSFLVVGHSLVT